MSKLQYCDMEHKTEKEMGHFSFRRVLYSQCEQVIDGSVDTTLFASQNLC